MTLAHFEVEEFADEVWRVIPSMPTHMASSHGRVKVIPYKGKMPNGSYRQYGGVPVTGCLRGENRYSLVYKNKNYKVHRLVCEAFNGQPSPDKNVCMHLDENSRNNRPENLAWGTQKENLNAPGFIAYCKSRTGENNPRIKGKSS
jgi:hypothetical protein